MRPMAAHNRIPTVPKDELALDQTLKHLRKLRWIGNEIEAQRILEVLDAQGRSDRCQTTGAPGAGSELWRALALPPAHRRLS
jgi:hypothetical protein